MALSFRTKINAGFLPAFLILAVISIVSYRNTTLLVDNGKEVNHTYEVLTTIEEAISQMKDLETGQRGFVITGNDDYIIPYQQALASIDTTLSRLQSQTADNKNQQNRLAQLRALKDQKVAELKTVIDIRRKHGLTAAIERVNINIGKTLMDDFRTVTEDMKNEEMRLLSIRDTTAAESTRSTLWVIVIGAVLSLLIILGATMVVNLAENERLRAMNSLENQNYIRTGLLRLSEKLTGEQSLKELAKNVVETLANFIGAQVGAIYMADEETGLLKWAGGHGFEPDSTTPTQFKPGDGLIGQAATQKNAVVIANPPNHYLKVRSALGEASVKALQVLPFVHNNQVKGVIELGSLEPVSENATEYLKLGLNNIAVAVNSAQARIDFCSKRQGHRFSMEIKMYILKMMREFDL